MVSITPRSGNALALSRMSELSAARHAVGTTASAFLGEDRSADVQLCVSELVTNGIEHGDGTGAVLTHEIVGDTLLISVSNVAATTPTPLTDVAVDQPAGRGLHIVDVLADQLDIEHSAGTVVVTCRFTR